MRFVACAMLCLIGLGAGSRSPVVIDSAARRASGPVTIPGSRPRIECRLHTALGLAAAECNARDDAGATARCTTQARALLDAVATVSWDSFIVFTWDAGGTCTSIDISQDV